MIKKMGENKVLVSCFFLYIITFFLPVDFTGNIVFIKSYDQLRANHFTPITILLATIMNIPLTIYQYFMVIKSFDLSERITSYTSLKFFVFINIIVNFIVFFVFPLINILILRVVELQGEKKINNIELFYNILAQVNLDILNTIIVPLIELSTGLIILQIVKNSIFKYSKILFYFGCAALVIEFIILLVSYFDIFNLRFLIIDNETILLWTGLKKIK